MKKISWKGVILGAIADVGGTNIWGIFFIGYIVSHYGLSGLSGMELMVKIQEITQSTPSLFLVSMLVGGMFSILGGYIAARIAKQNELLNGALSSFLCVLSSLYGLVIMDGGLSLSVHLLLLPLSPILGLAGGYLRVRTKKSA